MVALLPAPDHGGPGGKVSPDTEGQQVRYYPVKYNNTKQCKIHKRNFINKIVKLRQGSGKDRQGMVLKAKGLKA